MAIAFLYVYPTSFRRQMDRRVRRLFKEGANKGLAGAHELELIGRELLVKSALSESRLRLEIVEQVVSDGDYTFIYISATMAYVIPHDKVLQGDPLKFADAVRERCGILTQSEPGDYQRFESDSRLR